MSLHLATFERACLARGTEVPALPEELIPRNRYVVGGVPFRGHARDRGQACWPADRPAPQDRPADASAA